MLLSGTLLDRAPSRDYCAALRFAELALRAPLPRAATLAGWRAELPAGFALALRAPRAAIVAAAGALRSDDGTTAAQGWLLEAADALAACAVVLPTPAEITPSARSRDLLRDYVRRLPREGKRLYVWAPSGLWKTAESNALCAELGLVRSFDPLEDERPRGAVAYAQLRALGHRTSFSQDALERSLAVVLTPETAQAYVTIDGARAWAAAKRLQTLGAEAA